MRSQLGRLARLPASEHPGGGEPPYRAESLILGFEVAFEGMLDQGELTVLARFDKPDPFDGPYFEETIDGTPLRLAPAVQAEIATCAGCAAQAIGLHSGPIHAELRVNAEGPWMLEVAGRSIGGLCGQTLRFDMGTTLEEIILRQACGLPWRHEGGAGQASGVMRIPIPEAGQLACVEGVEAAAAVPGVDSVESTTPLHHTVTPLPEGDSYLGFIFARTAMPAEVEAALRTAHGYLHFQIVPEFVLRK